MDSRLTITKIINKDDGTDNLTMVVTNVTTAQQGLFTCLLNGSPSMRVSQYIYVDGLLNLNKAHKKLPTKLSPLHIDRKSEENVSFSLRSESKNEFFRVLGQQSIIPCRPVHPSIRMDIIKLSNNGESDQVIQNYGAA